MKTIDFYKSEYYDLLSGDEKELADGFLHHSFEADYELFDKRKTQMSVFFPYDKEPQSCLNDKIDTIHEQINWVVTNREAVVDCLIEENCVIETIEYWASGKAGDRGDKPLLPITREYINDSLLFSDVSVRFEDDMDKPRMTFCLEIEPLLTGYFFIMLVDADKKLTSPKGMAKYRT